MKYSSEQKLKITCPSCGHEQIVQLEVTMGARYMDDFIHSLTSRDTGAAFGSFECICGKKVNSWLLSVTQETK
jgi:transcription elongation factor Elf1